MLDRITKGWTFQRALFLILGAILIVQSIIERQWIGIVLGGYISTMGLFDFGCASGTCFGGNCSYTPSKKTNTLIQKQDHEQTL